jgi:hypothetical protein
MTTLATAPPAGALKNVDDMLVKHVRCTRRHAVPCRAVLLPARRCAQGPSCRAPWGSAHAMRLHRRCGAQNRGGTGASGATHGNTRALRAAAPHRAEARADARWRPRQAADVAALRAGLGAMPAEWDEIHLLRFCLSFSDAAKRETAARKCIAWRADNAALLAAAREGRPLPKDALIKQLCLTGYHGATSLGEPVSIVRAGLCAPDLLELVTAAEFYEWLLYQKELSFLACDAATRARRHVVKCISVVDLMGVTIANACSAASIKYQTIVAETRKVSEYAYPQLLGKQILLHPPRFFAAMFSVVKQFMSERVVEKLGICPGPSEARPCASLCPFASRRFDLATLPTFLGGGCKCTAAGGCVCGTPNERTAAATSEGETSISVGARAKHEVHLPAKAAGATLLWEFSIAAKGIDFSARLQPELGPALTLAPVRKHKAEEGVVKGEALVPMAGTVCISFDNGHSRITSKTVTFNVAVIAAAVGAAGADGGVMLAAANDAAAVVASAEPDDATEDEEEAEA